MADQYVRDHQAWLGYLQPDGLVVSPAALVDSQVILPRDAREEQQRFLEFVAEAQIGDDDHVEAIADLTPFLEDFLEWPTELLYGANPARPLPETLSVPLSEFGEILSPTIAFADPKPKDPAQPWLLLVQSLALGTDLDAAVSHDARGWSASPARRFERLLRETRVPIGLLANGTQLRLMYAPRGENAGSITFPVHAMAEVAGRPILAAFHVLLKRSRILAGPAEERLPALLARSRAYQSRVSTRLSGQVLDALYELLRGFQAADDRAHGTLLRDVLAKDPDSVYAGLLNVLLRMVFLLYAEDRGLMPGSSVYVRHYSVHGLFEKLRADEQAYPDTMDHRFGAWAGLLALFRAVHGGCRHAQLAMPAREGYLFDPERFPFLEGHGRNRDYPTHPTTSAPPRADFVPALATVVEVGTAASLAAAAPAAGLPLVSDGVIWRVLQKLLMLGGERLSYRTLDVEQIGSVYETMMGFRLEVARGATIALKPAKKNGAPPAVNLDALLVVKPADRAKWLREQADQKLEPVAAEALKRADSIDAALAALERRVARNATPHLAPKGAMVLQPSDERRRSGSHFTPRVLTEPIVSRTLKPILDRLGDKPKPAQILDLKVCDLAAGSGAFLVAACRELGDALVKAWHAHGEVPVIPPDEDEVLHARRLVAQRCLYGVDKNPMAVDLAKLSLWLATLARDHPFTFLDHNIRCGDSLVGLTRKQIEDFHWKPVRQHAFDQDILLRRIAAATKGRKEILEAGDEMSPLLKRQKLALADDALDLVRLAGDLVIAAFFSAEKDGARENQRDTLLAKLVTHIREADFSNTPDQAAEDLRQGERPLPPFHWEIEFPEVFQRENPGFDAMVGNPPFMGGTRISEVEGMRYFQWLVQMYPPAGHHCDLVAYFFRQAHSCLRIGGSFGLIATNTISQGDTREGGLVAIVKQGGEIVSAVRRFRWPGLAAVVVSIVHVSKGPVSFPRFLDDHPVSRISAYLIKGNVDESPARLAANPYFSLGSKIYGQGFLFDDLSSECTPLAEMRRIIDIQPSAANRVRPYIGGEEINASPTQQPHRFAIYFSDIDSEEELNAWPALREIVDRTVRPERQQLGDNPNNVPLRRRWWAYQAHRPELYARLWKMDRTLVSSQVTSHFAFALVPTTWIFSHAVNVFCLSNYGGFCAVQCRVHEVWARLLGSSMKDDLRYTPSDCFETFPFPKEFESNRVLEQAGNAYYDVRAALMGKNNEGLTKTYNHFHDPDETSPDILKLRELHAAMDRAVLDAYGWTDIPTDCEFLLDWEDEDDEEDTGRRRKKPWRLRWPDDVRDEVLARLLALNVERAAEEVRAGVAAAAADKTSSAKPRRGRKPKALGGTDLFDDL